MDEIYNEELRKFCELFVYFFTFCLQSWILKAVLTYQDDTTQPLNIGIALAVAALVAQFLRNLTYTAVWAIGIHTGKVF